MILSKIIARKNIFNKGNRNKYVIKKIYYINADVFVLLHWITISHHNDLKRRTNKTESK